MSLDYDVILACRALRQCPEDVNTLFLPLVYTVWDGTQNSTFQRRKCSVILCMLNVGMWWRLVTITAFFLFWPMPYTPTMTERWSLSLILYFTPEVLGMVMDTWSDARHGGQEIEPEAILYVKDLVRTMHRGTLAKLYTVVSNAVKHADNVVVPRAVHQMQDILREELQHTVEQEFWEMTTQVAEGIEHNNYISVVEKITKPEVRTTPMKTPEQNEAQCLGTDKCVENGRALQQN